VPRYRVPGMTAGLLLLWAIAAAAQPALVPPSVAHRAWSEGRVRVIVQLGVPAAPEGMLESPAHVAVQRHDIASAQGTLLSALAGRSTRVLHQYPTIPFLALELGPDALSVLEFLRSTVVGVEEDRLASPTLAQSTPLVQATGAWAAGFDGTGLVVAVLDTGVDRTHPFLGGKIVAEACFSGNANCPNGTTTQFGAGAAQFCTYAPSDCDHGTHVAGIAVGRGATFSGVARGAGLLPIQVFSRVTDPNFCGSPNPCAGSFTSDQIAGLQHVFNLRNTFNFASANMSLGGGQFGGPCDGSNAAIKAAIDNLRSVGIATAIASGNDGLPNALSAPACVSSAVSVGSTDDGSSGTVADRVSFFTNTASFLSLLAPGRFINSSIAGGGFANFQGTSMAAPHVAGAWAVLKQARPTATVSQILAALRSTGVPVADSRNGLTFRRIRILDAINSMTVAILGCVPGARGAPGKGDFDNDGKADIGVYRSSTGEWFIRRSSDAGLVQVPWGAPTLKDVPVPGRFDGDLLTDVAVYRCSDGQWLIRRSSDAGLTLLAWGAPMLGDVPVQGDYDGDGTTDVAIYRTTTAEWFMRRSIDGVLTQLAWGSSALKDTPVPGDYDGDGKTDVAIYRTTTGEWFIRRSTDGSLLMIPWGSPFLQDVPAPADYDGDGKTDVAVYRQSDGNWLIRRSTNQSLMQVAWGSPFLKDTPVPGDYDGDGKADIAVYRTTTGVWFIQRSTDLGLTQIPWGAPTLMDVPLIP
jgi:subtilisin